MNENSSSGGETAINSPETNENEYPEIAALAEEEFDEQIKSFIAPVTKQLEDLNWFVQGMTTASDPKY